MARDDTPGEALWYLCGRFAAAHDDKAARETLTYLIDRYPSSRMAKRAKDELAIEHPCVGVVPPSPSASGSGAAPKASP